MSAAGPVENCWQRVLVAGAGRLRCELAAADCVCLNSNAVCALLVRGVVAGGIRLRAVTSAGKVTSAMMLTSSSCNTSLTVRHRPDWTQRVQSLSCRRAPPNIVPKRTRLERALRRNAEPLHIVVAGVFRPLHES